jgi:hypothetical protein
MLSSEDQSRRIVIALRARLKAIGFAMLLCGAFGLTGCAVRSTAVAAPKPSVADWERVISVERGTILKVLTASGAVTGHFVSAEGDELRVLADAREIAIAKSDVQRVSVQRGRIRQKVKRGFALGALAGGLVGALTTQSNRLSWTAFLAAGWGGVGALIGALDRTDNHEIVIYIAHAPALSRSQGHFVE